MERKEYKIHNRYKAPKGKCVPCGKAIYEYTRQEKNVKTGKIETIKERKNIQEEIQSYIKLVDYKAQIARNEFETPIGGNDGNIKDFTGIPNNPVDIISLINDISTMDLEGYNEFIKQREESNKERNKKQQDTTEDTTKTTKDKSTTSSDDKTNTGGE